MGIKDFFLDFIGASPNGALPDDNQTLVPDLVSDDTLDEYLNSKLGKCDMMMADLISFKEVVPEQSTKLIEEIIEFTEKPNEDSQTSEIEFQRLQSSFEEIKLLANQKSKIQELQIINNNMKKCFSTNMEITQLDDAIKQYNERITIIKNSIDDNTFSTSDSKNQFIRELLISQYRFGMLQLLAQVVSDNNGNSVITYNPFNDLHIAKQTLFSRLLYEDVKQLLVDDFESIPQSDLIDNYYPYCTSVLLNSIHDDLADLLPKSVLSDNFSFATLLDSNSTNFDSLDFLRKFVILRHHINILTQKNLDYTAMNIRDREEAEIYKPIDDRIQEISNDLLPGNKHIRIIDYQRSVARERGLLEAEEKLQSQNLSFIPANASKLYEMIQNANSLGLNYTVFPDVQEQSSSGDSAYLFVVPTSEKHNVLDDHGVPFHYYNSDYASKYKSLGIYTSPVIRLISESIKDDSIQYQNYRNKFELLYVYEYNIIYHTNEFSDQKFNSYKNSITNVLVSLKSESTLDTPETLKNIKCYLSVPTQTSIIPILAEMKKSGIDAFMEPIVEDESLRNQKSRDFIHIYFNRDDIAEVQRIVEAIKSRNQMPISINGININLTEKILEECNCKDTIIGLE